MQHTQLGETHVLRIDRGEEVVKTITAYCARAGVKSAYFSGIGAISVLTCGYYNLEEKQYHFTDYREPLEVVSLSGNVTEKDGAPFVHVHGVFTDTENRAFGGHVVEMRVHVVLEVMLTSLPGKIERHLDACTGLGLMRLP